MRSSGLAARPTSSTPVATNAADDSFDWTFGWTGQGAVRRHSPARRRRGPRHRGGQQRVQQQRSASLEPAALQLHDVRRPGHERGRLESAIAANDSPRHGVHAEELPDYELQGDRAPIEIVDAATLTEINNGTSQMSNGVIWNIRNSSTGVVGTPNHTSMAPFVASGRFPNIRINEDGGLSRGLLEPREPELPADVGRNACWRPARAGDSTERRLLRSNYLHRRGTTGSSG